jgi:DNA modification methylase
METKPIWEATCACNSIIIPAIVLDIFFGSGTTGVVAKKLNRNFSGIELNSNFIDIALKRLSSVPKSLW